MSGLKENYMTVKRKEKGKGKGKGKEKMKKNGKEKYVMLVRGLVLYKHLDGCGC